ncbi:MAG: hypothetical protein QOD76_1167 [Solirubrobacteraceae bacterium]|nr:hypothetical protein [Solirubrobacteraceae bacterium]
MRARYPDDEGFVEREGVRVFYEVYGAAEPTILFLPGGALVPSRLWKGQVPYFARYCRVVTFDGRGTGKSDRPQDPAAYAEREFVADAIGVMDATATQQAIVIGPGRGAQRAALLAAEHGDRVLAAVMYAPDDWSRRDWVEAFLSPPKERYGDGWDRLSPNYFRRDFAGFAEWWTGFSFPEPHSTRQVEQGVEWALDGDAETFMASAQGSGLSGDSLVELAGRLRCPVLVICGERDVVGSPALAERLAEAAACGLVTFPGAGHQPGARYPVRFNLVLRDFVEEVMRAEGRLPPARRAASGR